MIEAQSRYLNALVGEVIQARQQGSTLILRPGLDAIEEYNDRLQAALRKTNFADPNCNSWYKTADGIITNNWSGTAVEYQNAVSAVEWQDYIAEGTGKDRVSKKKATKLGRVREESLLNNTSLLIGTVGVLATIGGYLFARPRLLKAS